MSAAPPSDASRSLRRVRWAQVLVYAVLALALVGSAVQSWVGVHRVRAEVSAGQGRRLLHALRRGFLDGRVPSAEQLARQVRRHEDLGLRCIAVRGTPPLMAGDCRLDAAAVTRLFATTPPATVHQLGPRVAMVAPPPMRHRMRLRPPLPAAPLLLVVYEPAEANALARSVRRSLFVSLAAVVALVFATVVLWRLTRRAELLQDAAERDRRLVTLGEMSAVLAHEIRNPLAALKGHAQLLQERLADGSPEHEKAARVVREARRLEDLTEDLLRFVRAPQIEPAPADPAALLAEATRSVDAERIRLDTTRAPHLWRLDAARIQQMLVNLLRNAVEASPADAPVEACVEAADAGLVFTVRDHGAGLPGGDPSRLFEPFYTTRVHGTGLGLAVARRIVELHAGTITARTHPEGGGELRVVLPA
ncbi:MAG: two-component sensor histidine kinase [bacterium]|nr:two-component sensor histidine kinase [bacterium]